MMVFMVLHASKNASTMADSTDTEAMLSEEEHAALKALVADLDARYGTADLFGVDQAIAILSGEVDGSPTSQ